MRRRLLVASGVLVLTLLAYLAQTVQQHLPPDGPRAVTGDIGQDVSGEVLQVHVSGVETAPAIADDDAELATEGAWVVVTMSVIGQETSQVLADVTLRDAQGREYRRHSSLRSFDTWPALTGLWTRGTVAFEVAADAAGPMELHLWPSMPLAPAAQYLTVRLGDPTPVPGPITGVDPEVLPEGQR